MDLSLGQCRAVGGRLFTISVSAGIRVTLFQRSPLCQITETIQLLLARASTRHIFASDSPVV